MLGMVRNFFAIGLGFAVLASFASTATYAGTNTEDYRYLPRHTRMTYNRVPNAGPAEQNHAAMQQAFQAGGLPGEHAVAGHRIAKGSGTVLAYREHTSFSEFEDEDVNAIFEKLTVFLPSTPLDEHGVLKLVENPEIIVFWSRGAAKFNTNSVCAGYAESGEIEYRRHRGRMQIKLDFNIRPVGADQFDERKCKSFRFLHESDYWESTVYRLTPWEGGGSGSVGDEECKPDR